MLEELTPEQESLMHAVRAEYIEKLHTYVGPDQDKVSEWVHWLYKLAGLEPPEVVIVGNHDEVEALIKGRTPAHRIVGDAVGSAVWAAVGSAVRDAVGSAVRDAVGSAVRDAVGSAVRDAVRGTGVVSMPDGYGNYSDFEWVAYYEFYTRIGVLNNEYFNKFKELCNLGIFDTLQYEGLCIVVKQPPSIKKAHEERLEKQQLKQDLIEADKHLKAFIRKHCTQQTT